MSRRREKLGSWVFSWFIQSLRRTASGADVADRGQNAEEANRIHNANTGLSNKLDKGCQTEAPILKTAANTSIQATSNTEVNKAERMQTGLAAGAAASGSYKTTISNGGAAPPTVSMSNGSTDDESESCPICFCELVTQKVATPAACNHSFCVDCLQKWFMKNNTCPIDRRKCYVILVRRCLGGRVVKTIRVTATNAARGGRRFR
jgi:hypothetical protein